MPRGTSPTLRLLRTYESRNVTFIDPDGSWPIVWERASGVHVWDENGNRHLDLTAAFGVAATGHANPRVIQAARRQMSRLVHAMGDVHPHRAKAELAAKLSELTFERWTAAGSARSARIKGKTIFCNSGFEAVEAALKTARLPRPNLVSSPSETLIMVSGMARSTRPTGNTFAAPFAISFASLRRSSRTQVIAACAQGRKAKESFTLATNHRLRRSKHCLGKS